MEKAFFIVLAISIFLVFSFAMVNAAHAIQGECVEQAVQCDGPGGPVTYVPCGTNICSPGVCPVSSLAYQSECTGNHNANTPQQPNNNPQQPGNNNPPTNTNQAPFQFDPIQWFQDTLNIAMGQSTNGGQVPTGNDRAEAGITLVMVVLVVVAVIGISVQVINNVRARIPASGTQSAARPVYPQLIKTPKRESRHDICTTPEHNKNNERRKKM